MHGAFLRVDVGTGAPGLHQQHGARAVAREPHIVLHRRVRLAFQLLQQMDQFSAGIVRQHALRHAAHRRTQQIEIVGEAVMQALGREPLRCHRVAQQIAVAPQQFKIFFQSHALTIVDRHQLAVTAQLRRHIFADLRQQGSRCAIHADKNQARHDTVAQLFNHNLLCRRRRTWQECGHVGIECGAADDEHAGGH